MDIEFIKYFAGLGVGGILAALMYVQNNKNSEKFIEQLKDLLILERGRTDLLVGVIKESTVAITRNTTICEAFHRRLDDEHYNRREDKIQ